MANEINNQNGVFGGIKFDGNNNGVEYTSYFDGMQNSNVFGNFETASNAGSYNGTIGDNVDFNTVPKEKAITKQGLWTKIRAFLFQEIDLNAPIKVELTPYQQKVEDEINDFLHQEVSFKSIANIFKGKK